MKTINEKQLKVIKDASAVASNVFKSKSPMTAKQTDRLFLAIRELNLIFLQEKTKKAKSQKELLSFIEYCVEHTQERFWQSLRNWTQINVDNKWNWIEVFDGKNREDTFYW